MMTINIMLVPVENVSKFGSIVKPSKIISEL